MKRQKRTLYECSHARVSGNHIHCCQGQALLPKTDDGSIDVKRLARGNPLAFKVCQDCPDYDCMGSPVPATEKGWLK